MGDIAGSMQYLTDLLRTKDIWMMVKIILNKKDGTFECFAVLYVGCT